VPSPLGSVATRFRASLLLRLAARVSAFISMVAYYYFFIGQHLGLLHRETLGLPSPC